MNEPEWGPAVATPLADLREVKLLAQEFSVPFGDAGEPPRMFLNKSAHHLLTVRQAPRWWLRLVPWFMGRRVHMLPYRD